MLIDTHAHLNFKAYNRDQTEVIQRCLAEKLKVINVGSQYSTSERAVELAHAYPGMMYAAVGFHPIHINDQDYNIQDFHNLIHKNQSAIIAVGEIGLDYYHLKADSRAGIDSLKQRQKEVFTEQVNLAQENNLPMIIHCREAYGDLYEVLESIQPQPKGVVHCWLGESLMAKKFLDLGLYLGFTGIITFTDNQDLFATIKNTPLEKILIETDAPYLTPLPFRGQRNEPIYVKYVAEKIAEIKGISYEEVEAQTERNAITLFNLK